jgi:hypothetical protein
MCRRVRPLRAILVVVFLQLLLVESGYACLAQRTESDGSVSMAGMTMPEAVLGGSAPAAPGGRTPCRFPWAPDGCQTMAMCAPAILAVNSMALPLPDVLYGTPVTREPLEHLSESLAPELPPPRT